MRVEIDEQSGWCYPFIWWVHSLIGELHQRLKLNLKGNLDNNIFLFGLLLTIGEKLDLVKFDVQK